MTYQTPEDCTDEQLAENFEHLADIIAAIQKEISDEYRAYPEDDEPGIALTLGWNGKLDGDWNIQTGDNSFTGVAYGYLYWGIGAVYRDSNPEEVAQNLIKDADEQRY